MSDKISNFARILTQVRCYDLFRLSFFPLKSDPHADAFATTRWCGLLRWLELKCHVCSILFQFFSICSDVC